jgi:hypothetical protein
MNVKLIFILIATLFLSFIQYILAQDIQFPELPKDLKVRISIKSDIPKTKQPGFRVQPNAKSIGMVQALQDSILVLSVAFNKVVKYNEYIHLSVIKQIEAHAGVESRSESASRGFKNGFLIGAGIGGASTILILSTWEYRDEYGTVETLGYGAVVGTIIGVVTGTIGSIIGAVSTGDKWELIWKSN